MLARVDGTKMLGGRRQVGSRNHLRLIGRQIYLEARVHLLTRVVLTAIRDDHAVLPTLDWGGRAAQSARFPRLYVYTPFCGCRLEEKEGVPNDGFGHERSG
jgi:hypothetical protein